jgi:hypothetical protein
VRSVRRFATTGNSESGALDQFNAISDCVKVIGILTFLVFAACYAHVFSERKLSAFGHALWRDNESVHIPYDPHAPADQSLSP